MERFKKPCDMWIIRRDLSVKRHSIIGEDADYIYEETRYPDSPLRMTLARYAKNSPELRICHSWPVAKSVVKRISERGLALLQYQRDLLVAALTVIDLAEMPDTWGGELKGTGLLMRLSDE